MKRKIVLILFLILLTIFVDKAIQGNLLRIKKIMENNNDEHNSIKG